MDLPCYGVLREQGGERRRDADVVGNDCGRTRSNYPGAGGRRYGVADCSDESAWYRKYVRSG